MSLLNTELPSIDLRAALDGVTRRWWLVALVTLITAGLVFALDSGMRTEPNGNVIVQRTYESTTQTNALELVKVDRASITPVPSLDNQLLIINSAEMQSRLRLQANSESTVVVTRSEPKFTIIESLDDQNNRVSFLSTGTPSYLFQCEGASEEDCSTLIDAYVAVTVSYRKESVVGGLDNGLRMLRNLISEAERRLADGAMTSGQVQPQRVELASLITKVDALTEIRQKITGELLLVAESSRVSGKSMSSVSATTFGFGIVLGLIIGLLLALQLSAFDKKIRHAWQIRRVSEDLPILGSPFGTDSPGQTTALAASLQHAHSLGITSALVVTHDEALRTFANDVLSRVPSVSATSITMASDLSVDQLAGGHSRGVIVLVKVGQTTHQQLAETLGLVESGGNRILGVALVR